MCNLFASEAFGFAGRGRDANPLAHTHLGLARPRFCISEDKMLTQWCTFRVASRHLSLASQNVTRTLWCTIILGWRILLCIPRTRYEPHGAHSCWVLRSLAFSFPERDANPMMHTNSELVERRFPNQKVRREPCGADSCSDGLKPAFCVPRTDVKPMVHTHSGLAKPRLGIAKTRCEPYGTHSNCIGEA